MIGLDIIYKKSDRLLYDFFDDIHIENYEWKIDYEEILFDKNNSFFDSMILDGHEFKKCISRMNYYIIFADIKAYLIGSKKDEVLTYNDYINSNCEMIFLCSDAHFIDFYCKNRKNLKKVYQNCVKNNYDSISIKTIENDTRTRMSVY